MEDVGAKVAGELRKSADNVAGKFGSSRTFNEGGSELQRGARAWLGRADELTTKVYDAISIPPKRDAQIENTRDALRQLITVFQSNPKMAKLFTNSRLVAYLDALTPELVQVEKTGPRAGLERFLGVPPETIANGGKLSWEDLKHFRSIIGESIGEQRLTGDDPLKSQLRSLYGALSEDMRKTAASIGPRQLKEFERANSFFAAKEARVEEALVRILGNDAKASPEKAALAVQAMTQGGKSTADLKRLAQVRASTIKSGAWDEIAATMIRMGGQPAKSSGREFSPSTFVNWYSDMAEPARAMLFKPALRKELDRFVAANQQLSRVKGLANSSNTAPVVFGGSAILTAATAITNPLLGVQMGATIAANHALGKLWTNQPFVNWATGYTKALASGNQNAVKSQMGRLTKLATTNPELRDLIQTLVRNTANDNVGSQAAADSMGENQQGSESQ